MYVEEQTFHIWLKGAPIYATIKTVWNIGKKMMDLIELR